MTYKYAFYQSGDFWIPDSANIYVAPGVSIRLRVDDSNFGPADVLVDSTNNLSGTLALYQVEGIATLGGNATVQSGQAQNLYYYGLPGVTAISCNGNSSFIGAIYAPGADLTLSGNGSITGSAVTKTVTVNGHYNIHYDEALLTMGPSGGYVATFWQEL